MDVDCLENSAPLADLTREERQTILDMGKIILFQKGVKIIEEGTRAISFFFILKGQVKIERSGKAVAILSTRDILGEMSLFNREIRVSDATAHTDTELLQISINEFMSKVLHHEVSAVKLMESLGKIMIERLQQQDDNLISQAADTDYRSLSQTFAVLKKQLMADWALKYHSMGRPGKLAITSTKPAGSAADLSVAYSPGVAEPCLEIEKVPKKAYDYTIKGQLVGVVTNGTAVLGMGSIGALAAKPVMEGKVILFKRFADVDAFDLEINELDPDKFSDIVCALEPTFGGINIEDIKAPECFYIEEQCKKRMNIPVFHDDQHGTAVIAGAGLLNALDLVNKNIEDIRVVFSGAGAAGFSCARYFMTLGVCPEHITMTDIDGVLYKGRGDDNYLKHIAVETDARTLAEAIDGADVFMGLSVAGIMTPEMLKSMNRDPIVFAMANPIPEIEYPLAMKVRTDIIMGTGRSDYPNQINNVSAFPYIFRGALDCLASSINDEMKIAATKAIAKLAREPITPDARFDGNGLSFGRTYIIPRPFDRRLLVNVTLAIAEAAIETGIARRHLEMEEYRSYLKKLATL